MQRGGMGVRTGVVRLVGLHCSIVVGTSYPGEGLVVDGFIVRADSLCEFP